jgi:hypothetical protein
MRHAEVLEHHSRGQWLFCQKWFLLFPVSATIEQTGKNLFSGSYSNGSKTCSVGIIRNMVFSGLNLYFQNISGCYSSYTVLPVANPIQRSALLENLGTTAHTEINSIANFQRNYSSSQRTAKNKIAPLT